MARGVRVRMTLYEGEVAQAREGIITEEYIYSISGTIDPLKLSTPCLSLSVEV